MAAFTYQGTIQFRRQTAAQWTAANVVLAQGELGLELDTKQFKMGDGVTAWTALAYGGMSSPNGTTANVGDNSTLLATTAFVTTAVSSAVSGAVVSFNTRTGAITLTSSDVTTALGYNPANMASPTFTGTVTSGSFSGSGSGLTGTAASLSIGGNAATATTATNNAGGAANQIRYQTGTNTSSYITAPSIASTFLEWNGSAFVWASVTNGTVTSIAVSGGTTGLTTSGGPITTSGTITLGGTLAVANGGTGSTTASSALTALGAAPLASPTFTGTVTIPSGAVISGFAPLASPVFTGSPTVPGYLTSAIAATTYAPLASPALTGVPIAPTATAGTNTTQLATTAFATAAANATVTTFNTRAGAVTLAGGDVTTALGFTPYNATNPSAYISANQTITATGDATGSGTTSIALTLASVGSAGTYSKVTTDAKGRVISGTAIVSSDVTTALGFTPENAANKGIANGYASLDSTGKLTSAQIPASLIGAVVYQGTWNATTNIPALVSSTGTKGYYYKVSVAGTTAIDGNSQWVIGDTIIFDGSVWDKIDGNAVEVISVAGRTGVVTLSTTDVSGISSYALLASPALTGTPTAPTATAGTNTTQLATTAFVTTALPTSNSQLTNGAGYVTALTAPVTTVAGRTGTITLAVADVSGAAPLASAALTGSPTAPTATAGTNTTQLATTAFVTAAVPTNTNQLTNGAGFITSAGAPVQTVAGRTGTIVLSTTDISGISSYAPLASPVLTGTPTVPTATAGTSTTQAASTAFVSSAITAAAPNLSIYAPLASPTFTGSPIVPGYLTSATATTTYAPLASPALTGIPVAPTATAGTNTTQLATTAFVTTAANATVTTFNTRAGAVTLAGSDVTTALGFTPYNATNPSAYISANQTITATGDATGSGTTAIALTLAAVGTAGTYSKVTTDAKGRVTSGSAIVSGDVTTALGFTPENIANKGIANGYASLDSTGKLTIAQIPAALVGAVVYQGTWNAATNTPTLTSGTGTKGWYYKVSVTGTTTIDTNSQWLVGDTIIFDGTTWDKIDGNAVEVISVAGRTGVITLSTTDIGGIGSYATLASPALTGIPVAPTATAGTNTTQLATTAFVTAAVPTNNNQLANGAGYVTALTAPVTTVAGRAGAVVLSTTDISGIGSYAPLASPALTGIPTVPTATASTTTTQAASTAFVGAAILQLELAFINTYAPLASPALTGVPVAPTAISSTNSTQLATTAFVNNAVQGITAISLTNANVTLSAVQYNSATILMTGTLTGNVTITFPASGNWTVLNETTGAFTVTLVATTGGSIVLPTACAVIVAALSTGLIYANSIVPATILESPSLAPVSMGWLAQVLAGVNTVNVTGNMSMTSDQCAYSILLFEGSPSSAATITLPTVPAILGTTDTAILWNQSGQTLTFVSANGGGTISLLNGESCSATLSNTYGIYLVDQVAPTPPAGDNSHKIATTAFVQNISSGTNIVSISGATTLNATQYSYACLQLTGTLSATATITLPNSGWWTVMNLTTGGYPVILSTGSGTTVTLTNGDSAEVIANATGIFITTSIANTPGGDNDNSIATTSFVQAVPYRRNRILNGRFQIWQRGVAWTTPASGTYLADKWRVDYTGTSAGTFTIGQALVHTQPAGLSSAIGDQGVFSWNQTGTPNLTSSILSTRVEGAYVLSGQTCTVSFEMALGAGSQSAFTVGVNIAQCPGTGGSPSATITSTTQNFTVNSATFTRFTATFTLPTMNGTYGTNGNDYVAVQLVLPNSQLYSFYLTEVQLETGDVATPFMVQNPAMELQQCMRFFQKTFPTATVPTYNTGVLISPLTVNQNSTGVSQWVNWDFAVPMRGLPAITLYSVGNNATPYWSPITTGVPTATAVPTPKIAANGLSVSTASSLATGLAYVIHAIADADL